MKLKLVNYFPQKKPNIKLRPSQTRWWSLKVVFSRILEHWSSMEIYFGRASSKNNIHNVETISIALKKIYTQIVFSVSKLYPGNHK